MLPPDHYQALGLQPDATASEIRAAYLRIMRASHPDRRPHDPHAAERARSANAAYEVLRDRDRRARYDRSLAEGRHGPSTRVVANPSPHPLYRRVREQYRRSFTVASIRAAAAILGVSTLALLATAAS